MAEIFGMISPVEEDPISALDFRYRIPSHPCPACGKSGMAFHLGYPHLDPAEVLGRDELKLIKPSVKTNDGSSLLRICRRLEDHWGVPVSGGAWFGPIRIKVTSRIKCPYEVLPISKAFFMNRVFAQALQAKGFDFDYVDAETYGKYGRESDLVQVVVPIIGHCSVREGDVFCEFCRYSHGTAKRGTPFLIYDSPQIRAVPFFLPLEMGALMASAKFIEEAKAMGVRGLVPGKTLFPMEVIPDPIPDRAWRAWPRLVKKNEAVKQERLPVEAKESLPIWDRAQSESWLARLQEFLQKVKASGGVAEWECGRHLSLGENAHDTPLALRDLLEACGGKLSFRYSLDLPDKKLAGSCRLDLDLLATHRASCKESAEETWIAEEPEERERWLKAQPFFALPNGDFIALDGTTDADDPPVVYLSHDDSSDVLSLTLADFLRNWEKILYLGPEIWILNDFLDPDTGYLSGDSTAAKEIRNTASGEFRICG